MKHRIDPKIDCVFKALFGWNENKNLTIHFLNAVLQLPPEKQIMDIELMNPYNDRQATQDKQSIVDVRARDAHGTTYQVDIQLEVYPGLTERILFTWCDSYTQQLKKGGEYGALCPLVSIWVIDGTVLRAPPKAKTAEGVPSGDYGYYHHFKVCDSARNVVLSEHCSIITLELPKFDKGEVEGELDRWTRFFREGEQLDDGQLPEYMQTEEMRHAMDTLRMFSEREVHYDEYRRRRDFLMEQATLKGGWERAEAKLTAALERERAAVLREQAATQREQAAIQEKQAATQREQAAIQEKQAAIEKQQQLLKRLLDAGISVDGAAEP